MNSLYYMYPIHNYEHISYMIIVRNDYSHINTRIHNTHTHTHTHTRTHAHIHTNTHIVSYAFKYALNYIRKGGGSG